LRVDPRIKSGDANDGFGMSAHDDCSKLSPEWG
jgi:hypothetical protein